MTCSHPYIHGYDGQEFCIICGKDLTTAMYNERLIRKEIKERLEAAIAKRTESDYRTNLFEEAGRLM